jgi:bacillithiol biosynthesis cysteine-adding enzyme BshC
MPSDCISFRDTNYFSSLICDYLEEKESLKPFYNRFPKIESFKAQIEEKEPSFQAESRTILASSLEQQYKNVNTSEATLHNIDALNSAKTFTVTTGHQLNLFTGPLYFLYKIVSAINLSNTLKENYPEYNFVPVYWMATEDHDFDEINYFNFKGKKMQWPREASGAVGHLNTKGLEDVLKVFASELNNSKSAEHIKALFQNAYLKHETLTEATRYLANELFKEHGLVIVDGDDRDLKRLFIPFVEEELTKNTAFNKVVKTSEALAKVSSEYKIQVNPREINIFYLDKNLRERIVFEDNVYKVLNTNIVWTASEILKRLHEAPECFSPNVIMRPLYQEVILPNLCYIGGGGELAYWLQLKDFFESQNLPFPLLLLRNSVLIQTEQQQGKLEKLNISKQEIFLKRDALINKKVREISNIEIDFSEQKAMLQDHFKNMYVLAEQTDKSFLGAVKAQERKQLKGLKHLEKRLLKAQKKKLSEEVSRMTELQNDLFPSQSLQERNTNFSEFYLEYGEQLIPGLRDALEPLKGEFLILNLE